MNELINLNGSWTISQLDGNISINGRVPGLIHHDLIDRGIVDEPYYRMNEKTQQWVGESTWEYRRTFSLTQEQLIKRRILLSFDAIDTIAEIFINESKIAEVDNYFIRWRFDIKDAVHIGENTLMVKVLPVRPVMEQRSGAYHLDIHRIGWCDWAPKERNFVRKPPSHSDWDWGPCFLTQGIPGNVTLECIDGASILAVNNAQKFSKDKAEIEFRIFVDVPEDVGVEVVINVDGQESNFAATVKNGENVIKRKVAIDNPKLWWPFGYGEQNLYSTKISLKSAGEVREFQQHIGLREIELVTEKDQWGESFFFKVNGLPIFAKGGNWIPPDNFITRHSHEQLTGKLQSAVRANHNMVRVWGGGYYESEEFYDLCDRLGLMVWQDCVFASSLYPANASYKESVAVEITQNIRRIAAHPSLAVICGNNENELNLSFGRNKNQPDFHTRLVEYDELFVQTIMPIVQREAPQIRYWPSSSSNGVRRYGAVDDQSMGDCHFWEVWHGGKPASRYLEVYPRFSSEFGFQSFSSAELMDEYTLPEDRNPTSRVFDYHQRNNSGSGQIFSHIPAHFRTPVGYENTLYTSQVLQALSMKIACEHWYRIKPRNMGCLIWQLNDIWPAISWSSLEYDGRWKVLHYYEKNFFAPVLVSSMEKDGMLQIWLTSELNRPIGGELTVNLQDFDGNSIHKRTMHAELEPMGSRLLVAISTDELCPVDEDRYERFVSLDFAGSGILVRNEHVFSEYKDLSLAKPNLDCELDEDGNGRFVLRIRSDTFTPFFWIRTGKIVGIWNDNGMHLRPMEERTLVFEPHTPVSLARMQEEISYQDLYRASESP